MLPGRYCYLFLSRLSYFVTDNVAVLLTPPAVTVMVEDVVAVTFLVETVKVTVVAPAGTVTLVATVAAVVRLDASVTTVPPAGAGPFKVIVPVLEAPPFTDVGFSTNVIGAHVGVTWRTAFCETALYVPVMFTLATAVTLTVVIANVADVAPAGTVTLAGTAAETLELVSVTTTPPAGAAPLRITVPVTPAPPTTDAGFTVTDLSETDAAAGFTVSAAVFETPPLVAVIVTAVTAVTVDVVTVNVAVVAPAATVTEAGTVAATLLDASVTTMPPAGAADNKVTVPVLDVPPVTDVGFKATVLSTGAVIPRDADWLIAPFVAVIVLAVFAATAVVVTVKVAVVEPAATVTLDGTVAVALLDASVTTKPPAGAAADSVTVPVLEAPPATDVGFNVTDVSDAAVIVRLAVWETPDSVAVIVADAFAATAVVVTVNVAVV